MKKFCKKALVSLLAASMLCPGAVFAENTSDAAVFTDVSDSDWYSVYVKKVCDAGIFHGVSESAFDPHSPLTRGMFATILARFSQADLSEYPGSSFTDVNAEAWYAPAVEWAYKNEITTGTKDGFFSPDEAVTRQDATTLIYRYLTKNGYIASTQESTKYNDADSVSAYAQLPVIACSNAKILQGDSDKNFLPEKIITRAEAAAVMVRLNEYISDHQKDCVLNSFDQANLTTALKALKDPIKEGTDLAKEIYSVAFSQSIKMSGTPSKILDRVFSLGENRKSDTDEISAETVALLQMVAPALYGGSDIINESGRYFGGNKKELIEKADLITGDILVSEKDASSSELFIYDGESFVALTLDMNKENAQTVLGSLAASKRFVILRPSYSIKDFCHFEEAETNLTKEQEALIATAETYLLRGYRVQYDDGHISPKSEYRWQHSVKAPEEYTSDSWGYTNCAAFVHDVYLYALGYDTEMWATRLLIDADDSIRPFFYEVTNNETEDEKLALKEKFYNEIKPGDIIVYRYGSSSGHAMLYTGNGNIIHSTGSTFSYDNMEERYEASIHYKRLDDIFTPSNSRYVFGGTIKQFALVRPLNAWNEKIPENTVNRAEKMRGVFAEKLSSHNSNITVNPGEEMTFTFSVFNMNDHEVSLDITDSVPENCTYVSGAEHTDGNNLSWNVTIPSGETKEVTYTVKVNDDPSLLGKYVSSPKGKVGGVTFKCGDVLIKNTLTKEEQSKITSAANELKNSDLPAFDRVNEIYKKALGVSQILPGKTFYDICDGVFYDKGFDGDTSKYYSLGCYDLKTEGIYPQMVVPTLYGGRNAFIEPIGIRTRLLREKYLIPGDIVLSRTIEEEKLYIYTGEGLIDLDNGNAVENTTSYLASLMGKYPDNFDYYFVVLRPSMVIE